MVSIFNYYYSLTYSLTYYNTRNDQRVCVLVEFIRKTATVEAENDDEEERESNGKKARDMDKEKDKETGGRRRSSSDDYGTFADDLMVIWPCSQRYAATAGPYNTTTDTTTVTTSLKGKQGGHSMSDDHQSSTYASFLRISQRYACQLAKHINLVNPPSHPYLDFLK